MQQLGPMDHQILLSPLVVIWRWIHPSSLICAFSSANHFLMPWDPLKDFSHLSIQNRVGEGCMSYGAGVDCRRFPSSLPSHEPQVLELFLQQRLVGGGGKGFHVIDVTSSGGQFSSCPIAGSAICDFAVTAIHVVQGLVMCFDPKSRTYILNLITEISTYLL